MSLGATRQEHLEHTPENTKRNVDDGCHARDAAISPPKPRGCVDAASLRVMAGRATHAYARLPEPVFSLRPAPNVLGRAPAGLSPRCETVGRLKDARWPPTPASTTTSASRGSRERSAGRHLRRDAARRRRAHQVDRPRLRHAARPRERRRNRLTGTHAQARKPSPSRGAGASTGVTWPHPFDSPSSRVAGRVTPPGAAGAPTGPPR